jgi:hypothetical protein
MEKLPEGYEFALCDLRTAALDRSQFASCGRDGWETVVEVPVQRLAHEPGVSPALFPADTVYFREHLFRERNGYGVPGSRHTLETATRAVFPSLPWSMMIPAYLRQGFTASPRHRFSAFQRIAE